MELNIYIGRSKGVLTIVNFDLEEYLKTNKKKIYANCICSKCNRIIKQPLYKILRSENTFFQNCCPLCKKEYRIETLKTKHIGKTLGVLKVIDFDHFKGTRAFLKCKCLRCGKETIVRDDRFSHSYEPKSCEHCYYNYLGKQTKKRYMAEHNFSSEKEYEEDKLIRSIINNFKLNAKTRLLNWDISDETARELITSNCFYCGSEPLVGIDRIDSSLGYTNNNVVPCCKICNIMKNAFKQDIFLTQIQKIYNNLLKSSSTTIPKGSTLEANASGNIEHPDLDGDIV